MRASRGAVFAAALLLAAAACIASASASEFASRSVSDRTYATPQELRALAHSPDATVAPDAHSFWANNNSFELDGNPARVVACCIHYFRLHESQWKDRLLRAQSMG